MVASMAEVVASVAVITLGVAEWAHGAANGGPAVAIGMAATGAAVAIGMVAIAMAAIGTVAIGMAIIGTAITGTATITTVMMSSLSVASAFHGVGAGVRRGAGADGAIRTDMDTMVIRTVTVIATVMAMATVIPVTDTATATTATDPDTATAPTAIDPDTATPANPEWPSCSAGLPAPVTIMGPSMAFWGLRRDEQFGPTNRTTRTPRAIRSLSVTLIS